MQQIMFSDRFILNENEGPRLNENNFVKIAMWFPSILKCALIAQWISDFYAFVEEKKIYRKSFGQTGIKYLLSDNDFSLFSCNN